MSLLRGLASETKPSAFKSFAAAYPSVIDESSHAGACRSGATGAGKA